MDETLNKIENLIATAEKFRSSYFWKAPTSARSVVLIGRDDVDRFLEVIG